MAIEVRNGQYVVVARDGKTVLGTHPSKRRAVRQLKAIQRSKKRGRR